MSITYEIMKRWIGHDVRVYFGAGEDSWCGKLTEICDIGLFLIVKGTECFIPFAQVHSVTDVAEVINDGF